MLRELKVWLKLKHSNIVPLHGTARIDSPLLALVSKWIPSRKLSDYLNEQAKTITRAARIELVSSFKFVHHIHKSNHLLIVVLLDQGHR